MTTASALTKKWMPRREADMKEPVSKALERAGLDVEHEVPVYGRVQDIVAFDKRLGRLIVVELKLVNWKVALRQCNGPRLWSDEVYVGLPEATAHRAARQAERFTRVGVGLLEISRDGIRILIPAVHEPGRPLSTRRAALTAIRGSQP